MHRKGKWMEHIRNEVARGLHTYRVHVVHSSLTDYLRYEFEWDYVHNAAAGEHIRILDLTEQTSPESRFRHGEVVPEGQLDVYRRARDTAWAAAVPFTDYWRGHQQYWRGSPVV